MRIICILLIILFSAGLVYGEIVTVNFGGHFESSRYSGNVTSANDYLAGDTILGQIIYDTEDFIRESYSDFGHDSILYSANSVVSMSLSIHRDSVEIENMSTLFPAASFEILSESSITPDDPIDPYFYDYSEGFGIGVTENISSYPDWQSHFHLGFENYFVSSTEKPVLNEPLQVLNPNYFDGMSIRITNTRKLSQNGTYGGEVYSFSIDNINVVPEPLTLSFLGLGVIFLRRKRKF